jgi:hypothetical protein
MIVAWAHVCKVEGDPVSDHWLESGYHPTPQIFGM